MQHQTAQSARPQILPWAALWSMVLGFFMILVDTTIVSVANPSIMQGLETTMVATLWATSAYLLAYAVPLLITGRLGDRFGPRRIYLIGLTVFTLSSLACGISPNIETLIGARVFQGLGASLMTPQTMAVITRIFGPRERGSAMAIWGVTAGAATLVGPILGGFLLDAWGWEWIFFINVPVGMIAFVLAMCFVPKLPTSAHRFDWLGVLLSAAGMFMLVFGIQEGSSYDWGVIWGPITVWGLIIAGAAVLALFVVWQRVQRGEPLIPLRIFRDRNFSVGAAVIVTVGLSVTSMSLPLMFFLQLVLGLTPTQSALMMVPMAILSIVLARPVGLLIDRRDPRRLPLLGLLLVAAGLLLYALLVRPDTPVWLLLIPSAVLGFGNAFMWGPLASITTFGLEPRLAGAGSGVYNTSRQVGAVMGSAAMAALMNARIAAQLGDAAVGAGGFGGEGGSAGSALPEPLREGFATAMTQSILMPLGIILVGAAIALFFGPRPARTGGVRIPVEG
ncbi:DHA2 family efflux MFS transporter permease subunit [Leucobacter sp. wl10]|uniref:DHA2 family efflux MFS transporter permease subunit n=1 Tax=Leucobacter sp. wl10 TaxID=2304677 RepID=UPI000E5ABF41|nr:DHA2 family efflux MFS transporter permease subunit [Leucobacter sp. wl10]RGE20504.1 DHA2 family efflux MFS transporter permease subunit [Leucobacter sp. wl10]